MTIPQSYQQEFFLREPLGNNAFDYSERSTSHPEPYLRVAPLQEFPNFPAAFQQLLLAQTPAFSIAEEGCVKLFPGLQNFLLFPNPDNQSPVFVFDNHNHAFFFWHWYTYQNNLNPPFSLIHIDQHKDSRIPAEILTPIDSKNEMKLHQYTNDILNVGNFIPPAIKTGLISEVININSTTSLDLLLNQPLPGNYILDLDLDFFAPELDFLNNELKIKAAKKALSKASIITIATSPYFIKAELAFAFLKLLFYSNLNSTIFTKNR